MRSDRTDSENTKQEENDETKRYDVDDNCTSRILEQPGKNLNNFTHMFIRNDLNT